MFGRQGSREALEHFPGAQRTEIVRLWSRLTRSAEPAHPRLRRALPRACHGYLDAMRRGIGDVRTAPILS